jgi:glucokinase
VPSLPSAGCVIGVDLGGTKLLAGAVDADLRIRHRAHRLPRVTDTGALLSLIVDEIAEVRDAAGTEVLGVGLGVPSLMDLRRGVAVETVHLPLRDVPIRDVLSERLGLPVWVDNDATCAMLAEHRHGAAAGTADAILLTIGTGIGGAIVAGGEVVRGAVGAAGEPGHMVVDADGPPCQGSCPNRGCLEAVASGSAIGRAGIEAAREAPGGALGRALADGREITGALVTELAHDGDPAARRVVAEAGRWLGVGIASLVNLLNPETVVVGGGVIAAGELLLAPAREVVAARALRPSRDVVRIVPAHFGADAGMLGAAILALEGCGLAAAPPAVRGLRW